MVRAKSATNAERCFFTVRAKSATNAERSAFGIG